METIINEIKERILEWGTPFGIFCLVVGVAGVIDPGLGHWLIFFLLTIYGAYRTFMNPKKKLEKEVIDWNEAEKKVNG